MNIPSWGNPGYNRWSDGSNVTPEIRVGELYGARSFLINTEAELTGVTYKHPWKPGPNTAVCWKQTGYGKVTGASYPRAIRKEHPGPSIPENPIVGYMVTDPATGEDHYFPGDIRPEPYYGNLEVEGHTPAGCVCGFHGYLKGSMDFATNPHHVSGVVKAWGTLVLGERGFRAQHAEVVALYLPPVNEWDEGGELKAKRNSYAYSVYGQSPRPWNEPLSLSESQDVANKYGVPMFTSLTAMLAEFPTTPPRKIEVESDE